MNDSKLLNGVAFFSIAMALFIAAVGMRYQGPEYRTLVPTSLAFTAIGMVAGVAARVASSLTRSIESLEELIKKANLEQANGNACEGTRIPR